MKHKKHKSSRRLLSLLIIICIGTLTISAQRVTKEEALTKAERFFKKAATRRAAQKSPTLVLANNRDEFYVFNDEANGGYVVVSGEKRMPEVLAYSDKGTFHVDDMPCNFFNPLIGNFAMSSTKYPSCPFLASMRYCMERK